MSGRLPESWISELRSRVPLEEVVSETVSLKRKGNRYWGCCPFHMEKTASFSVDTEAQMYYCFGCHAGGTVINFVMETERMEFMEAIQYLADRAHMTVPQMERSSGRTNLSGDERDRIYEANAAAARFYYDTLWTDDGAEALKYLYKRGLNDSDIRRFGLGASPDRWDALVRHLSEKGFKTEILEKAGLVKRKDDRVYDMFRGRAMFPIINAQGKVLGFGGRILGSGEPKYLNTADTPVFNKRQGLYALNMAKNERAVGRLVLVEGYMDTVSLRKSGIQGVVATLGTALTEEQTRLIKRYAPEVWISYDGDKPGQKAALRALDMFDPVDIRVKVIDYPAGMDPDDFVKAYGPEGFENLPRYDAAEYRMLRAKDDLDLSKSEDMTEFAKRGCEILKKIKSPIEMENQLRKLIRETGYSREVLLAQIGIDPAPRTSTPEPTKRQRNGGFGTETRAQNVERALITLLVTGRIDPEILEENDFANEQLKHCVRVIKSGTSFQSYIDSLDEADERRVLVDAANYEPLPQGREECLAFAQSCLTELRNKRLEERQAAILEAIKNATGNERIELYRQLTAISQEMEGEPVERNGY